MMTPRLFPVLLGLTFLVGSVRSSDAFAQEERCRSVTTEQVEELLEDLEAAIVADKLYDAEFAAVELEARNFRCVNRALTPSLVARYARDRALYEAAFTQDDVLGIKWARIWMRTAPWLPWPKAFEPRFMPRKRVERWLRDYGPGEPLVMTARGWLPPKRTVLLVDGMLPGVPSAESETPQFIQLLDARTGERVDSFTQDGGQFDAALLGPPGRQATPRWYTPEDPDEVVSRFMADGWLEASKDPYDEWEPYEPVDIAPPTEIEGLPDLPTVPELPDLPEIPVTDTADPTDNGAATASTDTSTYTPPDDDPGEEKGDLAVAEGPKPPKEKEEKLSIKAEKAPRNGNVAGIALAGAGGATLAAGAAMLVVAALDDPRMGETTFVPGFDAQQAATDEWVAAAKRSQTMWAAGASLMATGGGMLTVGGTLLSTGPAARVSFRLTF